MRALKAGIPLLLLALLPTLFLWKLTLAGRILVGLDPFNFFYPYHDALARALAEGRLPAWNPTLFGGAPFLADSQAQIFYPLGWPFLWLSAPAALTWGIALHLALAGIGTYAWARAGLGLSRWGAWVAGVLFALGGYLGAQVEHLNQVQAAAWLPWLLLGYERSQGPAARPWGIVMASVALAMSFLAGHAQTTFISLVMLGLWALRGLLLNDWRTGWRALLPLAGIVLIGGLLAGVQLVPTQLLSALSTRAGGLAFRDAAAFSLDPRVLPRALLPTFGQDERLLSEYVGWIGFLGLALALLGATSRARAPRDFGLLAAGTGLFLALGGYNPLFWLLWRVVPGFALFRAPARWLLLWALGTAILAGAGLDRLEREGLGLPSLRALWANRWVKLGVVGTGFLLLFFLLFGAWPPLRVLPWWVGSLLLAALALGLRRWWPRTLPVPYAALVALLLLAELWAAWWGLDLQKATAPEAYSGLRPAPAHLLSVQSTLGATRLLSLSRLTWDPGDLGALQSRHAGLLGEEAIYDLVVATKLKELFAPNQPMRWNLRTADGYGGGLLPSARWVTFQRTLPLSKIVPDGRLREQLSALPRAALLDVMGVEWLVADKVDDWWSEGVFHDLGAARPLAAGEQVRWETVPWEVTALSFVVIGEWPKEPGSVTLGARTLPLAAASEVATRETGRGTERHLRLAIDPPARLEEVMIEAERPWTLGGLSLVDARLPAFEPLPAEPLLRPTFSGDVKVYRREGAVGRAWVVPRALAVQTVEEAAQAVAAPAFDARRTVIVEGAAGALPEGGAGTVTWQRDEPEEIALHVNVPQGGWLVLADTPFPGWRASVDGEAVAWQSANVINRALFLPPGGHRVLWRYESPGLRAGLAATLLGGVLLVGWLFTESQKSKGKSQKAKVTAKVTATETAKVTAKVTATEGVP